MSRAVAITFRPLPVWTRPTSGSRRGAQFRAGYDSTIKLLAYEVERLGGDHAIIGAGFTERDIRRDGLPRADARFPAHPGVEFSFDSDHGRLVYATDAFVDWRDNLRGVALGLEALRAVNRYGIAESGQQYAGYRALTAGGPSASRGRELIRDHGGITAALKATHPDHGGDAADFADVQAAREEG